MSSLPAVPPPRTVVLVAHPRLGQSRVTRRLAEAARALIAAQATDWASSSGQATATSATAAAAQATTALQVRDLYALYPDQFIDAGAERAALQGVRRLVWLHPWQWYGMTPLLKQWLDEVLTAGWAFGPGGQALTGVDLWLVTSTGGSVQAYQPGAEHGHAFDAFLPAYRQTAALCGMHFLPPLVLHQAHAADEAQLATHTHAFVQGLLAP